MIGRIWRSMLDAAPVRLWAMILAAPPLTTFACWLVWIVWKGPWAKGSDPQQLLILGWALWGSLVLIGVIVGALAMVKLNVSAPGGFHAELDSDDDKPTALTTTTTTTETKV